MSFEMNINNVGFSELKLDEMLSINGGGSNPIVKEALKGIGVSVVTDIVKDVVITGVKKVASFYGNAVKNGLYDHYDAYVGP